MRIYELFENYDELEETFIPSNKKVRRTLLKKGYTQHEGGEHTKFYAPDKSHHIAIPRHQGDLSLGVYKSLKKITGLTDADF